MRAYVDTNILVDLVLSRQEFLPNAQRVFAIGYAGEAQLVVSALSFVNTVYLVSAIDEQADCIVTRNKKDFKAGTLPVLSPVEFFNKIDSK